MLATDHNGDGLIKYTLSGNSGSWPAQLKYRPANWWDTIGFGHEDAYANALAYRALNGMAELARQSGHPADQARYRAAADKLRAAYFDAFYNPASAFWPAGAAPMASFTTIISSGSTASPSTTAWCPKTRPTLSWTACWPR